MHQDCRQEPVTSGTGSSALGLDELARDEAASPACGDSRLTHALDRCWARPW